jgi:hypothetical protein
MRTAVDSTVLLDVVLEDTSYVDGSMKALEREAGRGALIICPAVYAEAAAAFTPTTKFTEVARDMGLIYDVFTPAIAVLAAQMWQDYRRRGGPRRRIITDFLIGAHAQLHSGRLLTRDRGYFREYFHGLEVITP